MLVLKRTATSVFQLIVIVPVELDGPARPAQPLSAELMTPLNFDLKSGIVTPGAFVVHPLSTPETPITAGKPPATVNAGLGLKTAFVIVSQLTVLFSCRLRGRLLCHQQRERADRDRHGASHEPAACTDGH